MKHLLKHSLLIGLLGVAPALVAEEAFPDSSAMGGSQIVVSSGGQGGGYWGAGERLQAVAQGMGFAVENQPSSGSLENLERLTDSDSAVNMAFAQADALQHYLNTHVDAKSSITQLENIGQECVFILTGVGSGIRSDKDLQTAGKLKLGIASDASGIGVTFDYMASLVPELKTVDVVYGDTAEVMDQLHAKDGSLDAVMVVHRPREHSPEVDMALENPHRYRFVKISDERFTQELENGSQIYRSMRLAIPGAEAPVETICVRGLLLLNPQKMSDDQRSQLAELVSYHWMRVYATP